MSDSGHEAHAADDDPLPYEGLRVVDLSQGMAGPNSGMQFAAYGADVIKIEPLEGDWIRKLGRQYASHSALSLAVNRGKRSIALDLKKPEAIEIVRRLVARADVLLENNRPGVADRLGLGWDAMRAINPRLVYVSMTGFGQKGPYAQRVSTDTIGQAFSGMMSLTRDDAGKPMKIGYLVIDAVASLYGFQATAAALLQQVGQHLNEDDCLPGAGSSHAEHVGSPDIKSLGTDKPPVIHNLSSVVLDGHAESGSDTKV